MRLRSTAALCWAIVLVSCLVLGQAVQQPANAANRRALKQTETDCDDQFALESVESTPETVATAEWTNAEEPGAIHVDVHVNLEPLQLEPLFETPVLHPIAEDPVGEDPADISGLEEPQGEEDLFFQDAFFNAGFLDGGFQGVQHHEEHFSSTSVTSLCLQESHRSEAEPEIDGSGATLKSTFRCCEPQDDPQRCMQSPSVITEAGNRKADASVDSPADASGSMPASCTWRLKPAEACPAAATPPCIPASINCTLTKDAAACGGPDSLEFKAEGFVMFLEAESCEALYDSLPPAAPAPAAQKPSSAAPTQPEASEGRVQNITAAVFRGNIIHMVDGDKRTTGRLEFVAQVDKVSAREPRLPGRSLGVTRVMTKSPGNGGVATELGPKREEGPLLDGMPLIKGGQLKLVIVEEESH